MTGWRGMVEGEAKGQEGKKAEAMRLSDWVAYGCCEKSARQEGQESKGRRQRR